MSARGSSNHVFTSIGSSSGNQPTRSSRSWTDSNGVHYKVDSTSWSGPGISFGAMTGSASGGNPLRSFTAPSARPRSGLFGNAFGLLDDLLSIQQQRHQDTFVTSMGQGQPRRVRIDEESDTDDEDDLAYEDERSRTSRPNKGMFSRLKDRLLDGKQRPRRSRDSSYERSHSHSRERSPAPRPQDTRRRSTYRTETREPTFTQAAPRERAGPEYIEVDYDEEDEDDVPQGHTNANLVEALESAVESERRAVRACKKRLEQAIRQPGTSSHYLQRLVDELKGHENSLTQAQGNLDEARARQKSTRPPRPQSYHPRTSQQPQQQPRQAQSRTFEDEFFSPFGGFGSFFSPPGSQHPDPIFRAFEELNSFGPFGRGGFGSVHEQMFADVQPEGSFRYFSSPNGVPPNQQRKRTRYSMPANGGASSGFPSFAAPPPPPPPQPPVTLLKPDEAKRLFKTYNDRWTALSPSDPNIPFPARGLSASSLHARDTLWAPLCASSISTWSDEDVMKANAQAFFLGTVGLTPEYKETPATGRIEMGFDRAKANPAQVQVLRDMLKKERMRWHSDRLGKRNGGVGGSGGVNEELQRDVRARAVFHAVCELMESAGK